MLCEEGFVGNFDFQLFQVVERKLKMDHWFKLTTSLVNLPNTTSTHLTHKK
jgi:hypothetical protein